MITVHGRATSGNVQLVMWAIAELGLPHRRLDVGGSFGGTRTSEFLAMNPNGLVPVVEDRGATLFESAAIVRYLGASYAPEWFWPSDPLARARLDVWAEWGKTTFNPAFYAVFSPLIFTPAARRDEVALAAAVERLNAVASILDANVPEHGLFAGGRPCFADIIVGAPLFRFFTLEFQRLDTPRLRDYYGRLTARAAYTEHVMILYDSLRVK